MQPERLEQVMRIFLFFRVELRGPFLHRGDHFARIAFAEFDARAQADAVGRVLEHVEQFLDGLAVDVDVILQRPARDRDSVDAAVFVVAVIGLFVAGTAFTTLQEGRAALGALAQRAALEAAEYGATAVLRDPIAWAEPPTAVDADDSFSNVSPQISAAYRVMTDQTVYATLSRPWTAILFGPVQPAGVRTVIASQLISRSSH